ncbi:MAG: diguanylate cyclase [Pseudomonadota bacterium]|nr:diguanylate cyclase [Pseudomonadota bacterium]
MQLNTGMVRRYDEWLIAITLAVVALFLYVVQPYIRADDQQQRISEIRYTSSAASAFSIQSYSEIAAVDWTPVSNPVNLGMQDGVHWFNFSVRRDALLSEEALLEVAYPLLDNIEVSFFTPEQHGPVATLYGGDALSFTEWDIRHPSMLFTIPAGYAHLDVVLKVKTSGAVRLPVRVWNKTEFIEYTSSLSHLMGAFFGFLLAIGVSNFFFFLTTRSATFLLYTAYVISLSLTLATLNGQAFAYLWPQWGWFEQRAVAICANAAIMFAMLFSRALLEVSSHSRKIDKTLKAVAALFGLNVIVSLFLPYAWLIKVFLVMLGLVVIFTLAIGIWLAMRGHTIARYYSFAWSILLVSGLSASLDNLGVFSTSIPSNYLLMLGASVETLLLTFIIAIGYSQQKETAFESSRKALEQEKLSAQAREDLVEIQRQYADEMEYKVQERTLELEIALRELSQANEELERLNSIDSLTGIRNRRHFDKRLLAESRRSRREQTELSLAMIDIDHFKSVNDEYGHAAGDACICHIARLLQSQLRRSSDDVCRYGGEEFGIILPNTDIEGARQVVEYMRRMIEQTPVEVDGQVIQLTMSAGVACAVIQREAHELDLLKYADSLLYRAKQNGRNQVVAEIFSGESS